MELLSWFVQQCLESLKASNRLSELEATNKIPEDLSNDNDSSNNEGGFPPASWTLLPLPSSLDSSLLSVVPTSLPKNNKAKTWTENAVSAINNLLKEDEEKVIIIDKLNTNFPEAIKILEGETASKTI